ncbi:MAG: ECF transporter S component [Clostridia bacterium]|nr:ECF transporter S component [Clostridiales bacterium]MCR5804893.1 ECF transporter S component [Clostridia bacterium]
MSEHEKDKLKIRKIAYIGVLAALIFVGTELHIPTAIGHVNLGDLIILVASYILGPIAAVPSAIGAAAADLISGYAQYALPTFLIKGIMGFVAGLIMKRRGENKVSLPRKILAGVVAELIMVAGYFAFESMPFMYGVAAAAGSLIPNLIQGGIAIIGAIPLTYVKVFDKVRV